MGVVIRILVFVVGLLGISLTGLSGAADAGVDTTDLLMKLGETPGGVATSATSHWAGLLNQLGGMMAGAPGGEVDPETPNALATWGPEGIAGVISALLVAFSVRR